MKVVINSRHGGFSLSQEAVFLYETLMGKLFDQYSMPLGMYDPEFRSDPLLIKTIEILGEESSSGEFATLKIIEIPDNIDWQIEEYDGLEWIAEKHRVWE